jgi:hypothetical protein
MIYQDQNTISAWYGMEHFAQRLGAVRGRTPDVMQFTGLVDKDGKDIYEGDVFTLQGSTQEFAYVVKYEDAKFVMYHLSSSLGKWGDLSRLFEMDFQLVGNIYEHSHLLDTQEKPARLPGGRTFIESIRKAK